MHKPTRLVLAVLAAMPLLSQAQVVAPPSPPPGVAPVQQTVTAPAASLAPSDAAQGKPAAPADVIPPDTVNSLRAGANLPAAQPDLVDVMIPAAPEKPSTADLVPAPPEKPKAADEKADAKPAKSSKKSKSKDKSVEPAEPEAVTAAVVEDPFAGIAATPVSDSQLNRFVFPDAIEGVYFPEGAPLPECPKDAGPQDPCKPVFLNGRRMMLLQLRAGARGPVQMLVHLHSGRIETLNLLPVKGPGTVTRIAGAEDGVSDARLAEAKAAAGQPAGGLHETEQDVALLARFAKGDIPMGFDSIPVGSAVRYDLFDVVPMATWSNGGNLRAHLKQIRPFSEEPVAVNPGLFRSAGIKALALDRQTITASQPGVLYVLEEVSEAQ